MRTVLLALALVCGLASSAQAANSHVQTGTGSASLASTITTGEGGGAALNTTVTGNALICTIRWHTQAQSVTGVTDGTNTLTVAADIDHGGGDVSMTLAYDLDITGTATEVTATFSAGTFDPSIVCNEIDVDSGIALDGSIVSDNAEAGTAVDCPSITPANNGAYIFAAATAVENNNTFAPNTGTNAWVESGEIAGSDSDLQAQHFVQATAAAISAEWTQSNTGNSMCMAMAISAAGGGGATPKRRQAQIGVGK